uniref:Mutated flavonoid 3', 5' hydroxylase n=1 Tax=Gentiana scabra x Gentiana triflora TaxID=553040 RepID=G1UE77_9GENT|nr:mutated flavonoid 3', 5' hydroxylase [Gentiana scabra x Gentiana triflora]
MSPIYTTLTFTPCCSSFSLLSCPETCSLPPRQSHRPPLPPPSTRAHRMANPRCPSSFRQHATCYFC